MEVMPTPRKSKGPNSDVLYTTEDLPFAKLQFVDDELFPNGVVLSTLPAILGRKRSDQLGECQFIKLPGTTVSRQHASISWDSHQRQFVIKVHGRNPITVSKQKVHKNESATLQNKTAVAIATSKFYFLLPRRKQPPKRKRKSKEDASKPAIKRTRVREPVVEGRTDLDGSVLTYSRKWIYAALVEILDPKSGKQNCQVVDCFNFRRERDEDFRKYVALSNVTFMSL